MHRAKQFPLLPSGRAENVALTKSSFFCSMAMEGPPPEHASYQEASGMEL